MARIDEIIKARLKKIDELRKKGIEPYPYSFDRNAYSIDIIKKYNKLNKNEYGKETLKIAGRVLVKRSIGKIAFCNLLDDFGKLQVVLEKNYSKDALELFNDYIDIGDFVGVEGLAYRTQRGEISVMARKITILCKSLMSLPEKWHGLRDVEERFRHRYLDLIANPEVKEIFRKRAKIINMMRDFLNSKGYIEVETPILQEFYGGAAARPFTTYCNVLKQNYFLRISPELYLKKIIIGGFEKIYEFARNFRNEGIDASHNPEFAMLEFYEAYRDYEYMADLTKELIMYIISKMNIKKAKIKDKEINLEKWQRLTMHEAFKKFLNIDIDKCDEKDLMEIAKKNGLEIPKNVIRGVLIEHLFDHLIKPNLINPTFIFDYPIEISPLTKKHKEKEGYVERWELFIGGMEIANTYSELNDAIEQEKRFKQQEKARKKGLEEAWPSDYSFLEALKYGMPPCGGVGIGIDRLVMIMTNSNSIREVIFFPHLRTKE